ncbi:MAG TPA: cell division protein ZapA [Acidiferrobacter sp.]|nr:cell division protein ZapA [Acidiferrobacter sp.]
MAADKETIHISVLGKEFTVACPKEERDALVKAARYLDARMQEGQRADRPVAVERNAVMAALNMAYELLRLRERSALSSEEWNKRICALSDRVDGVLREEFCEKS